MKDTCSKTFIELIDVTVGNIVCLSHTLSANEWRELYSMAKKQSLVGICFAGVQKLQVQRQAPNSWGNEQGELLYLQWMGMAAKIQQRNEVVNRQCVDLQKKLNAEGFRSCILKGQGVARLYDKDLSSLRQSGDIDIWIDGGREQVIDYVMKKAPTKVFDQKHIHLHCFDDTEVEAHWIPVKRNNPIWNRTLKQYFDSERERQFSNVGEDGMCFPTADFQLVHQLLHVYGHYIYEGVGMRQLMDLYFAQRACLEGSKGWCGTNCLKGSEKVGVEKVVGLFKKLSLMRFVAGTQWILKKVFGMPDDMLLCEPDEKEGKQLLDEIMLGGNFGQHNASNNVADESFIHRFYRRWKRKVRMMRFDPWGVILMPFARIKLEIWMRKMRKQYGL